MSANNITGCPRCAKVRARELDRRRKALEAAYGTMPAADYGAASAELAGEYETPPEATFCEYYEIGLRDTGNVELDYWGKCDTCGLEVAVKHEDPVEVSDG